MKSQINLFILSLIFIHTGCSAEKVEDGNEDIVVEAIFIENPRERFQASEPVVTEILLDGRYLGKTPIRFTPEKRKGLGLPNYERIAINERKHWVTWDIHEPGELLLRHPESKESKRILKLKKPKHLADNARYTGMHVEHKTDTGLRISIRLEPNPK